MTESAKRTNPFYLRKKVKLPKKDTEQKGRALNPEEIRKLLDNCLDDAYPIVATALFTGMRRGEVLGLLWDNVDFEKNQIQVTQELFWKMGKIWRSSADPKPSFIFPAPKSKASIRKIDMSPRLRRILLEYRLRSVKSELGLVFASSGGNPIEPDNFVKRRFQSAVAAAGLGKVRFHDLRHTFGSLKIEQGESLKYVQVQMGHSSILVTMNVYTHLLKDSNPEAAARPDEMIFGRTEAVNG